MAKVFTAKTFEALAKEVDGKVYYGYSGRAMFGKKCTGITCAPGDVNDCVDLAKNKFGLKNARFDSMGLSSIVYWPEVNVADPEDEDEVDELEQTVVMKLARLIAERLKNEQPGRAGEKLGVFLTYEEWKVVLACLEDAQ